MNCSLMKIPSGFKIRKKVDCDTFIEKCMCNDNGYVIIVDGTQVIMKKDKNGDVSVDIRQGNLKDIFNPYLEVARTKDNCYDKTVQDYIWKYRKAINEKWFNEKGL